MQSAFELVKQAEEKAEERVRSARQMADEIRGETQREIKAGEDAVEERLSAFKERAAERERQAAEALRAKKRDEWNEQKAALLQLSGQNREGAVRFLVKKVLDSHGDC